MNCFNLKQFVADCSASRSGTGAEPALHHRLMESLCGMQNVKYPCGASAMRMFRKKVYE